MNAPAQITKLGMQPDAARMQGAKIDKKRFGWLLSPGLPVIGMGILAGYHFGPKATKKTLCFGWTIITTRGYSNLRCLSR